MSRMKREREGKRKFLRRILLNDPMLVESSKFNKLSKRCATQQEKDLGLVLDVLLTESLPSINNSLLTRCNRSSKRLPTDHYQNRFANWQIANDKIPMMIIPMYSIRSSHFIELSSFSFTNQRSFEFNTLINFLFELIFYERRKSNQIDEENKKLPLGDVARSGSLSPLPSALLLD